MRQLKFLAVALFSLSLAACQTMTGRTAGENVDDATITTSVKSKLAADKLSTLTRVDVDTRRGTVYLNGVVQSPKDKERAEQLAMQVGGVNKVVNNLQIQGEKPAGASAPKGSSSAPKEPASAPK
jgi:osmotically-inducible protein OsmY